LVEGDFLLEFFFKQVFEFFQRITVNPPKAAMCKLCTFPRPPLFMLKPLSLGFDPFESWFSASSKPEE
jgi:hypothetical protein